MGKDRIFYFQPSKVEDILIFLIKRALLRTYDFSFIFYIKKSYEKKK